MKTTPILALLLALLSLSFVTISDSWKMNFDEAKTEASKENKHILLSFQGSDWCGNCMKLEKALFESDEFSTYAKDKLVLLKADFPMKKQNKLTKAQQAHNDALAEKFNKKGAFPKVVILDSKGEFVGDMAYPLDDASSYIKSIKTLVK